MANQQTGVHGDGVTVVSFRAPACMALLLTSLLWICGAAVVTAQGGGARDTEPAKDSILYRFSFDTGVEPEVGHAFVKEAASNQFAAGRSGNGYLIPGGTTSAALNGVSYVLKDHPMATSGAIAFWIAPLSWSDPGEVEARGSIYILRLEMAGGGKLLIQRQGFRRSAPKREDYLIVGLYGLKDLGTPAHYFPGTRGWKDGEWHLIAVNWDPKGFELSVDSNAFKRVEFPRSLDPAQDCPSGTDYNLTIGLGDADPETTLLDELVFFTRPLALEEIQRMYRPPPAILPPASSTALNWTPQPWLSRVALPLIRKDLAPAIDGVIDENEWAYAGRFVGAHKVGLAPLLCEDRQSFAWVASDGQNLYLAMKTEMPEEGPLRASVSPRGNEDLLQAWNDDSVELWLAPGDNDASDKCYQIVANSLGAVYDVLHDPTQTDKPKRVDKSFRVKWDFANRVVDKWWHVEIAMPLGQIGVTSLDPERPLGLHFVRNWKAPDAQADWTPYMGDFSSWAQMGRVSFGGAGPVVRQLQQREKKTGIADLQFEIVNPHTHSVEVYVDGYSHSGSGNPEKLLKGSFIIPAGQSKRLTLDRNYGGGQYRNSLIVTSANKSNTYFSRKFVWNNEVPSGDSAQAAKSRMKFLFGYYPSFNKVKVRVDLTKLPERETITAVVLRLMDKKTDTVIAEGRSRQFKQYVSEMILDLPVLEEGEYIVQVSALGEDGKEKETARGEFTRKRFDWENNTLGVSDEVIDPFTPLEVKDRSVSAVLRTHKLSDVGLLEEVTSEGRAMLASPMAFDIAIDGAPQKVSAQSFAFTEKKPNAVRYRSAWQAGKLQATTTGLWDYDGLLKCEIQFSVPETSSLDKFDLLIPVSPKVAEFLHVASDRMRLSFHDYVPPGKDVATPVWQSNTMAHNEIPDIGGVVGRLPGTFVPYVWLGNERQGISWVADNDSGWLVDDIASTHSVYRTGNSVLLKVSFVTKPGRLKGPHKIVFGLQATPTKPLPEKPDSWRRTVFSMPTPEFSGLCNALILWSGFQWGGEDAYAMYPRNKDFSIYSIMRDARATGRVDVAALDEWTKGYDDSNPYFDIVKRNIKTIHGCAAKPDVVIPYTDVRGAAVSEEEFGIFQDEWLIHEFTKRKWPKYTEEGMGYVISTTRSRQDFIIWNFNRMLESGAFDAIYFDCPYPKATLNTLNGGAYVDENGKLRASADIFEMRELFKRCAVLAYQKRGYNMNVAHMSTVNVAPLLSWFGVNLDWEFSYGSDDFQDRGFSREYTRIVTIGQQTGTIPLVLGTVGIRGQDTAAMTRAKRTLAGCILAHEVKDWAAGWGPDKTYENSLRILYGFSYGSDATVHNYWEEDFPATIKGTETAALLLAKDGEALAVVTDYANGGSCELSLDAAKLKLKPDGRFYDAESGLELEKTNAFACKFALPKHDFRIVRYR